MLYNGGLPFPKESHTDSMRRSAPLNVLLISILSLVSLEISHAQSPEEPAPTPLVETPPPPVNPPPEEHLLPELTPHEQEDAVLILGELRGAVRISPQSASDRLKLA